MNKEVTMLLNTFPSISETFILNQVVGLKKAGYRVNVISLKKPDFSKVHPDYATYDCGEGLALIAMPASLAWRLINGTLLFAKLFLLSPPNALRAINRKKYRTAASSLKNLYVLNKLRRRKIPLLHAHFGPNGLVGTFLKDAGIVGKLVVTFHGSDINSYPRRYGKDVYERLYERADLITANTAYTKDRIVENGARADLIRILPVGLETESYPPRQDPGGQGRDNPCRILTVGRLAEKKGYPWAIDAVKSLISDFPGLSYHIVGDGPMREELRRKVRDLGLENHIIFTGLLNADEVKAEYAGAHVFVLASVTASDGDKEGQGLVLQEAQAMGIPVVSTLHNGIPDGVREGVTGFLVPEKDSGALAERIALLLNDEKQRTAMGQAGREFVCRNYDTKILTERLDEMYGSPGL